MGDIAQDCRHKGNFTARANVVRLIDLPGRFAVDLVVTCDDCRQPLRFLGLPGGMSFERPTCDPFAIEARLPAEIGAGVASTVLAVVMYCESCGMFGFPSPSNADTCGNCGSVETRLYQECRGLRSEGGAR